MFTWVKNSSARKFSKLPYFGNFSTENISLIKSQGIIFSWMHDFLEILLTWTYIAIDHLCLLTPLLTLHKSQIILLLVQSSYSVVAISINSLPWSIAPSRNPMQYIIIFTTLHIKSLNVEFFTTLLILYWSPTVWTWDLAS